MMMERKIKRFTKWKFPVYLNRRQRALLSVFFAVCLLVAVGIGGTLLESRAISTSLTERNVPPSFEHPFGTDWLGRDMFARTISGLVLSIQVGLIGAASSVLIALSLGLAAATWGRTADRIISWLIDLFLSLPHLVTMILIAFVSGGGMKGVILGVALTHWTSLARVIRAEVLQLKSAEFVQVSRRLGKSRWWVASRHIFPHLIPQLLVGLLLLFPHAILHEASITFLGLGLSPHQPAIGIILSESMRYLSTGMWWLTVLPGLALLTVVRAFDRIGDHLHLMLDPHRSQE
ncbi:ABC transporter permease [Parageobacillus thermoglucosidasius]|uniref:Peptide ABC transporter permease n=1 Tax=Parageobacillus thermoglucosidasius TaxID=1426 RepID=A0AAN0YM16_PARTM|nr:ABC transporter permease [Parageobacillus thermoglucosidasius]ALF09578.1 peptide ABC transporter permease [Parageobacillus thermoglucosidasius]ANZ29662.1 peptide ABC transporter permease [Parageobacillus thermoglucosidasius]APM80401.1 peptide ABC transporter permease [Parageobacillus thermoglucosidasius]KJX67981.1 peptide ABC transporter permease [Parageobacillus thermoglucosidasius]RDE20976.1 ABC transporter permease [Parageobacillus thermoglucosidasius]